MGVTMNITIEQLKEHEKAQYTEVLLESYAQYEQFYTSQEAWQAYVTDIRNSVHEADFADIFVAKNDEEILGGLHLFVGAEKAYGRPELQIDGTVIRLVGVHPKARGLGIAKKLLHESFAFARARGDEYIHLHSTDLMDVAIQLYLKLGFIRDTSKEFMKNDILVKSFKYKL
ncbi:MAG: GNAT family N-acetyltransferase [Solibacillus sp.]